MNITDFKTGLAQFIGTMYYHKLSLFPVLATDGVKYFCEKASAFWLFDDMSAVTVTKAKNEEFIVAVATSKDDECDVVYDDGNGNKVYGGLAEELLHICIRYSQDNLPEVWRSRPDTATGASCPA